MHLYLTTFLSVLPYLSFAIEYNAAINAKTNISSAPVDGHPNSYATDLDLNTYFQIDSTSTSHAWVQFDLSGIVYVKNIILWLPDDIRYRIFLHVRNGTNVNYDIDIFCTANTKLVNNCSDDYNFNPKNKFGRYVLLINEILYHSIKLSEVIIVTENIDFVVATLGQVNQSSVFRGNSASKAIDGNIETCIHTAVETESERNKLGWWRVDMMQKYNITAVQLNDAKAEEQYKGFFRIYLTETDTSTLDLCISIDYNKINENDTYYLKCNQAMNNKRYLLVVKNEFRSIQNYRKDALNFCDIIIFALHNFPELQLPDSINRSTFAISSVATDSSISSLLKTPDKVTTTSIIEEIKISIKNVTQNQTYRNEGQIFGASNAVDNNQNTCSFTALEVSDSLRTISPGWWRADLGQLCEVHYLIIDDNKGMNTETEIIGYFDIYIDKEKNNTFQQLCLRFDNKSNKSSGNKYVCKQQLTGQYLSIVKIYNRKRADALELCEVHVYGRLVSDSNTDNSKNNVTNKRDSTGNNKTGLIVGCVIGILAAIILGIVAFLFYKKEKSTDCDSALIPLLCVHG